MMEGAFYSAKQEAWAGRVLAVANWLVATAILVLSLALALR